MATKTMTASGETEMTDGQIENLVNKLRDAARLHRGETSKDPAQEALGTENLGMMMWVVFRELVEEISKRIIHIVYVNRARSPREALKASGRKLHVTDSVVDAMPCGKDDKVRLVYFRPDDSAYKNGWLSCVALAEEYKKRDLVPDPQAQIDDNVANPEFADEHTNVCQWVDADGNYCYAAFGRWFGERRVYVYRSGSVWFARWAFAGVPQGSSSSAA